MFISFMWMAPLQLIAVLGLVWLEIGPAALAGVGWLLDRSHVEQENRERAAAVAKPSPHRLLVEQHGEQQRTVDGGARRLKSAQPLNRLGQRPLRHALAAHLPHQARP